MTGLFAYLRQAVWASKVDKSKAESLWRSAAEQGDSNSQVFLGHTGLKLIITLRQRHSIFTWVLLAR